MILSSFQANEIATPQGLFTFDGAFPNVNAAMTNLADRCKPLSVDLFKFAATCYLVEQPNDVGHVHAILKGAFKSAAYKFGDNSDDGMASQSMVTFKNTLKESELDSGRVNIFLNFKKHLEDTMLNAYTRLNIAFGCSTPV